MSNKKEEERDRLFDTNLGDGLIEVETKVEQEDIVTNPDNKKSEKKAETEQYIQYEDGVIEINENNEKKEFFEDDDDNTKNKEEEKKTTSKSDTSGSSSPSSSPYLAFARDRAEEGVFLEFTDEDWNKLKEKNEGDEAAALRELHALSIREMVNQGVESFKESLTPEERTLYEAKQKGVPVDKYSIAKRNFDKYNKIQETDIDDNEELQIEIVTRSLEKKGFTEEEISEEIEGYKALDVLEKKAKKAMKTLPSIYKEEVESIEKEAKDEENSRIDKIRQRVTKMKSMVDQIPEIIPGIKLSKSSRESILKSMTEPVATDESGRLLNPVMVTRNKNPEAFEMLVHYYHTLGLFNIDESGNIKPDFSKISKVEQTKVTDKMRSIFESNGKEITGRAKIRKDIREEDDDFDLAFSRIANI